MNRSLQGLVLGAAVLGLSPNAEAQKKADASKDELATGEAKQKDVIRPDQQQDAFGVADEDERAKFREDAEKKLSEVRVRAIKEMRAILSKPSSGPAGRLYRSCIDEEAIELAGTAPLTQFMLDAQMSNAGTNRTAGNTFPT